MAIRRSAEERRRRLERAERRAERRRSARRARAAGLLQVGRARPHAPAIWPRAAVQVLSAALYTWPEERYFVVAVYARYAIEDPGDGERYPRSLEKSYGRRVSITPGRHYYGWRGETMSRQQLERFAPRIVPGILETYGGRRPVRAVSVRPTDPTR